jgi:ABC-type multidrug transport system fused ATPase/permease subunit
LELQGVVFAYPGRPTQRVLNGLSLAVSPGEVVALVGPSGGGKVSVGLFAAGGPRQMSAGRGARHQGH